MASLWRYSAVHVCIAIASTPLHIKSLYSMLDFSNFGDSKLNEMKRTRLIALYFTNLSWVATINNEQLTCNFLTKSVNSPQQSKGNIMIQCITMTYIMLGGQTFLCYTVFMIKVY